MDRDKVYSAFVKYFDDIQMTKMRNKYQMSNGIGKWFSIYYAKINCLLCLDNRYCVVITPGDSIPSGTNIPLSSLQWESFQTRSFENLEETLENRMYSTSNSFLKDPLKVRTRSKTSTIYLSKNYPLKVEIIHAKDVVEHEYPDEGYLDKALETYNCVVSFI